MKVRFWGVRGSFATPGPEFMRYGGNTTAVEFIADSGQRLLVDLGTGVTEYAKELLKTEFGRGLGTLPILLSHTHIDHIQGLPFFTPIFIKGNRIKIVGDNPIDISLKQVFQNQLNPHYSPLNGLENLAAGVTIEATGPGSSLPIDGFEVSSVRVPHGSIWTLGFRISADGHTATFLSDVEYPQDTGPTPEALALARNADLLIHDATYSDEEYLHRQGWGHSPVSVAIQVAERAWAKQLALFHHNSYATDFHVERMTRNAQNQTDIPLFAAAEGAVIDLGDNAPSRRRSSTRLGVV